MSFLNSLKHHTKTLISSANNAIQRMNSYPDEVMCANDKCRKINPVPAATFMWTCFNGHVNDASEPKCSQCPCTKKEIVAARRYVPSVVCNACGSLTVVSEWNVVRKFDEAMRTAPDAIESTFQKAMSDVRQLGDDVDTFPCDHCTTTLTAPKGPWTCLQQGCSHANPESTALCIKCKSSRYACGVMCGVCSRLTRVPSAKFVAAMNSSVNSALRSTDASMKQLQGAPFAYCKHCNCILEVDRADSDALLGSSAAAGDVPSSPESRALACKTCRQTATYTGADIVVQRPQAVLDAPTVEPERRAEGPCQRCPSTAWRRCQACDLCFCNTHAPFIRRVPSAPHAPPRAICRGCVIAYDEVHMAPAAPPAAPAANAQAEAEPLQPMPPNAVPEVADAPQAAAAPAAAANPAAPAASAPSPKGSEAEARRAAITGAGAAAAETVNDDFEDNEKFSIEDETEADKDEADKTSA